MYVCGNTLFLTVNLHLVFSSFKIPKELRNTCQCYVHVEEYTLVKVSMQASSERARWEATVPVTLAR